MTPERQREPLIRAILLSMMSPMYSTRRAAAAAKQILENRGRLFQVESAARIRKPRPGRSQDGVNIRRPY
jgi:hypothetical protein